MNNPTLNEKVKRLTPSDTARAIFLATRNGTARICPGVPPALSALTPSQKKGVMLRAALHAGFARDLQRVALLNQRIAEKEVENEILRATIRQMAGRN